MRGAAGDPGDLLDNLGQLDAFEIERHGSVRGAAVLQVEVVAAYYGWYLAGVVDSSFVHFPVETGSNAPVVESCVVVDTGTVTMPRGLSVVANCDSSVTSCKV